MIALIALLSSASAATNEVAVEAGWFGAYDRNWDLFSPGGWAYGTFGVRGGYKLTDRLAVVGSWHHGKTGMELAHDPYMDQYEYDGVDQEEEGSTFGRIHTSFTGDQLALGAKADWLVAKWFDPYATVQLVGMRGVARFDDDTEDDENVTQLKRAGVTGGFFAGGGADFPIVLGYGEGLASRLALAPYVELGYGWLAPMRLEDAGGLHFYGFTGRTGVALQF